MFLVQDSLSKKRYQKKVTVVPPLSASLIIIDSSFCNIFITLDSDLLKFCFILLFVFVFGKSSIVEIYLSRAAFLSECGIKLLLFLTSDLSLSSVPSKYSISLSFLLNYFKSSVSFSAFPAGGVGVNFNPLFSKVISESLSCLCDRFIIFMSLMSLFSTEVASSVLSSVSALASALTSAAARSSPPAPT